MKNIGEAIGIANCGLVSEQPLYILRLERFDGEEIDNVNVYADDLDNILTVDDPTIMEAVEGLLRQARKDILEILKKAKR